MDVERCQVQTGTEFYIKVRQSIGRLIVQKRERQMQVFLGHRATEPGILLYPRQCRACILWQIQGQKRADHRTRSTSACHSAR